MSTVYQETPAGQVFGPQDIIPQIKLNITRGLAYRKRFEPTWKHNAAMASGQFWLEVDRFTRQLVMPDRLKGRELYTADVITEYRTHVLGELGSGDDRPQLLLRRDDGVSEEYQEQANRALSWGWDHEWDGDAVLAEARRLCIDLGTSAIRCRFDPSVGDVKQPNQPYVDGRPVFGDDAIAAMSNGPTDSVQMRDVRQGRIVWEPLSAFNLIVPPGVPHEKNFPWECVVRPVPLDAVQREYGAPAAELKEDSDIGSLLGDSASGSIGVGPAGASDTGRLRDHVWLYTYFEKPTARFPRGRTVVLASNQYTLLSIDDRLPYVGPNGDWRSGLAYFHWWRVTGRFYSRALIEPMKDIQRGINKRRTQISQTIDHGQAYVIVQKDSLASQRKGVPAEVVEISRGEQAPQPVSGIQPGPWMQQDIEAMREDLTHAVGVQGPSLGNNPANVTTYSQLALLREQDATKREPIVLDQNRSIAQLVEDSIYDMRTYWGEAREIALAGDNDQLDAHIFNATQIPPFYIVRIAKGSARPRSEAAELQKITDIWNAAVNSTAVQSSPPAWVKWYKESLEAGEALDLPGGGGDAVDPAEKAELENHYMQQGVAMPIAYYDQAAIHLPRHRAAQDQAMFTQDMQTWQVIEQHCRLHIQAATAQAEAQMQMQQPQQPQQPGATPSPPAPPTPPGAQP